MKYAVSDKTSMEKIPRDTEEIHLTRPLKVKQLSKLLKKCPIGKVTLSDSCMRRLPAKTKKLFDKKHIAVSVEEHRGRAIDIPLEKLLYLVELHKDHQSVREIERLTSIPKSTIHYLIKYSNRGKIKKGSQVVYLK